MRGVATRRLNNGKDLFLGFLTAIILVFCGYGTNYALSGQRAAGGQVIYVKAGATGANSGLNWDDAYTDLQTALAAAAAGDEIWVAAGAYKPTAGADRTISFVMKVGVGLYGGFAGGETGRGTKRFYRAISGYPPSSATIPTTW